MRVRVGRYRARIDARGLVRGLALCAGIGGIELGIKLVYPRYRTVCYVEREAFCAAHLVRRMEEGFLDSAPIWSDLRTFDGRAWRGKVDIVTGGYPCQPFSVAGNRRGAADPRHLWPEVFRVLIETEAPFLFCENVRGHVRKGLRDVIQGLSGIGFNAEWDVFSAEEEGAPHRRERLFFLAYASGVQLRSQSGWVCGPHRKDSHVIGDHGQEKPVADADGQGEPRPQGCNPGKRVRVGDGCQQESWWTTEPDVGRVAHGVSNRVDRLRALGNGVIPAVAARAFGELMDRAFGP